MKNTLSIDTIHAETDELRYGFRLKILDKEDE